jgi:Transposase IS4
MMQLQLVTTAEHEETRASEAEVGLKHGTVVLDRLVRPRYGKGDRIVCADSYFASVEAALHLQARGVRFIGVVKTATSSYPMKLLQSKVLPSRGDWCGSTASDGTLSPPPPASWRAPCAVGQGGGNWKAAPSASQ